MIAVQDLPPRQAELLAFLVQYQDAHGISPSTAEMQAALGVRSPGAVAELVAKLEARGAIARQAGAWRAIRILGRGDRPKPNQLPLMGRIAAGAPITSGEHIAEYIDVTPALFDPRANLLFRVQGQSMVNIGVLHGDLIGVHLQDEVSSGQIVAAVVVHPRTGDAEMTLKRYRRRGQVVTLLSENDDQERYPPLIYDLRRDQLQIVGIYCGLVRGKPQ